MWTMTLLSVNEHTCDTARYFVLFILLFIAVHDHNFKLLPDLFFILYMMFSDALLKLSQEYYIFFHAFKKQYFYNNATYINTAFGKHLILTWVSN